MSTFNCSNTPSYHGCISVGIYLVNLLTVALLINIADIYLYEYFCSNQNHINQS